MIRLLFVFVVVLAAIAAAQEECTPGKLFRRDCNTCICSKDGKLAACTLMECPPEVHSTSTEIEETPPEFPCQPGSTYNDYCNVCACSDDGKSFYCTQMACNKDIMNKDGTFKLVAKPRVVRQTPRRVCKPGSTFKNKCNTCACSEDGTMAFCTQMACPEDMAYGRNNRGKREVTEQICTPNQYFKDYCNNCRCSDDGRTMSCTDLPCDKSIFNQDGSLRGKSQVLDSTTSTTISNKVCEPGSVTSQDGICNICICNKEGTQSACTKNFCSSYLIKIFEEEEKWGALYKQGDNCLPGKAFYSECNQCVCRSDGRSAFCTLSCVT